MLFFFFLHLSIIVWIELLLSLVPLFFSDIPSFNCFLRVISAGYLLKMTSFNVKSYFYIASLRLVLFSKPYTLDHPKVFWNLSFVGLDFQLDSLNLSTIWSWYSILFIAFNNFLSCMHIYTLFLHYHWDCLSISNTWSHGPPQKGVTFPWKL